MVVASPIALAWPLDQPKNKDKIEKEKNNKK